VLPELVTVLVAAEEFLKSTNATTAAATSNKPVSDFIGEDTPSPLTELQLQSHFTV
jgi:hypothetical protein